LVVGVGMGIMVVSPPGREERGGEEGRECLEREGNGEDRVLVC
jgi:hypothetical protein